MEKFLSIPVTSEGNQLISANNIVLIDAASATATTTVITYAGGKVITLTHAAQVAFRALLMECLFLFIFVQKQSDDQ